MRDLKKVTNSNPTKNRKIGSDHPKLQDYDVGKLLGTGSYSKVYLLTHKETKKKFALKVYNKVKNLDLLRKKNLEVSTLPTKNIFNSVIE